MNTTRSCRAGHAQTTDRIGGPTHPGGRDEAIPLHYIDPVDGAYVPNPRVGRREDGTYNASLRPSTNRVSGSHSIRVSRQKSRRRDFFARQAKPGITIDTNFTRHKGTPPRQVVPQDDDRSGGSTRMHNWLGVRRSSTKNKGLGITKGTPQPSVSHRANPSLDQSELQTAISLTPGSRTWQDMSPWDQQRIPIGISVPTDSISDFSSYQGPRQRSGSDATLVTPNITITPAEAMNSVWSPDTPYSGSDYTSSMYSHRPADGYVPPVPALPAGFTDSTNDPARHKPPQAETEVSGHNRHDTLDSNGTAFEEDDDLKRSYRIMSTGTMFEEDVTPLRERTVNAPMAIDTSLVPTPRRSQGWWNVITTPFVTTPNTAVFPQVESRDAPTPAMPLVPTSYGVSREPTAHLPSHHLPANTPEVSRSQLQQTTSTSTPTHQHVSPPPARATLPVVGTAAVGTVVMSHQVKEQPQNININIELQDRRPNFNVQTTTRANTPPPVQRVHTSSPAPATIYTRTTTTKNNISSQVLPVFAPPPTHQAKGSHFSYDHGSRSSSRGSTPDLKRQKEKKHRKVFDIMKFWSFGKRKRQNDHDLEKKKKKKKGVCFWGCCCCIVLIILLAIIIPVAVILTKKGDDKSPIATTPAGPAGTQPDHSGNSGWLSLPNYPPIPTGTSTIAQPEAVDEESGCVAPTTLWSCALPKELQDSIKPNKPDQPNFRIQITYDNGSAASPVTKRSANPVSAGTFIRSQLLKLRALPSPSPAPPSNSDLSFLGKTTDGNLAPFEGEGTPLFITFQDAKKSASRFARRTDPNDPTNITAVIPPPMLESDGTAAAANLLPLPSAQPLRLYNRGKENEHYGFYSYFDRSIFLKEINGTNRGGNPADTNGGSLKAAANLRCTFSETRFLVQIWTRSQSSKPLLQGSSQGDADPSKRPGTFPYPVTVTLDRHGGNAAKKNLYCYGMESDGTIKDVDSNKSFQFEDRAFGGNLVNGTQGRPNANGPIDGGTGGCRCQWQNWLS
jgi:hypothetical protein